MRRLRLFVCEYVTGGGFAGASLPPGLVREGDMMLGALVKDLAELPGVELVTTRDRRLPDAALPATVVPITAGGDPWAMWRAQVAEADATWPIAPETGGILERLSGLVLECRRPLLGSRPTAVRLAASKRDTALRLAEHGLATLSTVPLASAMADGMPPGHHGWVVKPDDGAGAEDAYVLRSVAELRRWSRARQDIARFVVQPFVEGAAASLSLLCAGGRTALLGCNSQDVRFDGDRLRYHGGVVGGRESRRTLLQPIAERIAAAMPDLWGHVGVDLVEAKEGPVVIEINPRLTTSYVGLRRALGINPAELALQLLDRDIAAIPIPGSVRAVAVRVDGNTA